MRFSSGTDACLSLFADVYDTGALVFPVGARVLEIGCSEANWIAPMLALRPDLQITGIDWRRCDRPGTVIHGDVLTQAFQGASFDAIVGISSIEHIGLGHYSNDPLDEDGDRHCMERVATWLTPGGSVYLDVPFAAEGYRVHGTEYRVYDESAYQERLIAPGLTLTRAWYSQGESLLGVPPTPYSGCVYVALLATRDR